MVYEICTVVSMGKECFLYILNKWKGAVLIYDYIM